MPIRINADSGVIELSGGALKLVRRLREFAGFGGEASFLLPRWLFLRGLALWAAGVFANTIIEGPALFGPGGIAPVADTLARAGHDTGWLARIISVPTLLWLSPSDAMILALGWCGLVACLALLLNLAPRAMCVAIWACYLSLSVQATQGVVLHFGMEPLLVEASLLAAFLAPRGLRPGLARSEPPAPIAIFLVRWLAFRVMFEPGISKVLSGDPIWRELQAMEAMYPVAVYPTILAFYLYNMPHWWHLCETALTALAELILPVAAIFSRRLQLVAVAVWAFFQLGIWVTSGYTPLNFPALMAGVMLLDDQCLRRLLNVRIAPPLPPPKRRRSWSARRLAGATILAVHFYVSLVLFAIVSGVPGGALPWWVLFPVQVASPFWLSSSYHPFANIVRQRTLLEFAGSADHGKTWRVYPFKTQIQNADQLAGLTGLYLRRFEQYLLAAGESPKPEQWVLNVGRHLLENDPAVLALFKSDPFAGARPDRLVIQLSRLEFTDPATQRATGRFWTKTYQRDYAPMLLHDPKTGAIRLE